MVQQPDISVIMPAYNCAPWIGTALASLAAQDHPRFEVIVVDDGSTDDTLGIAQDFAQRDERFTVLSQEHASAGAARNQGLAHAAGAFYVFLDADDAFDPTLLSTLHAAAEVTGADIALCGADCFDDDPAQPLRPYTAGPREFAPGVHQAASVADVLYQSTTVVLWNKLFRADLIDGLGLVFQDQPRYNDAYFTIIALAHARILCKVDDVLVHYRVGTGKSLVDRATAQPFCDLWALDAARVRLQEDGVLEGPLKRSFDELCVNTIVWRLAHFARSDTRATHQLFDAYFGDYVHRWGLEHVRWPTLSSPRYVIGHALIRRAGADGLVRASAADAPKQRAGHNVATRAAFAARLAFQAVCARGEGAVHGREH